MYDFQQWTIKASAIDKLKNEGLTNCYNKDK